MRSTRRGATTVAYSDRWLDSVFKFGFTFTQKWMSADGAALWMIFSGLGVYESFNVIKGTLTLPGGARTRDDAGRPR